MSQVKGPKTSGDQSRPIMIKLHKRPQQYELKSAAINHKPKLYVNESLTYSRRGLFTNLRLLKKESKSIKQCYTHAGVISVLHSKDNKDEKFVIKNKNTLYKFPFGLT